MQYFLDKLKEILVFLVFSRLKTLSTYQENIAWIKSS